MFNKFLQSAGLVEPEAPKKQQPVSVPITSYTPSNSTPSFVVRRDDNVSTGLDPKFLKFYEDELKAANFPGPDYFEYKQLYQKTKDKLASKGVTDENVIIQAVLAALSVQDVTVEKLIESANRYKELLSRKGEEQIANADVEKNKLYKQRETVSKTDQDAAKNIETQLAQLEQQRLKLNEDLSKLHAKIQVNSTIGQEQIDQVDRFQKQMTVARTQFLTNIDNDIQTLQNSH